MSAITKESLLELAERPELLEIGRKAVEDVLIDYRDSRISQMRGNGLVCREANGSPSSVIRLGPEDALRNGLRAIAETLKDPKP